jgi:hypothetical protein
MQPSASLPDKSTLSSDLKDVISTFKGGENPAYNGSSTKQSGFENLGNHLGS